MKLKYSLIFMALSSIVTAGMATSPVLSEAPSNIQITTPAIIALEEGQWDSFNRQKINQLLQQYGKNSDSYDAKKPPYVVFDWDNTSIFLDIQEALMIYQLENLQYAMTPEEMNLAIRKDIPQTDFSPEYNNQEGQPVNIDKIAEDIVSSYRWIYENYDQMAGQQPLTAIKQSPQFQDFIAKMRYLYEAIGDTFDHSVSYPWATYHFTGLTEDALRKMTAETVKWQQTQPIESVTWTSPDSLSGKAGVIKISWKNGLRLVPEMQDLYTKLRQAGFDVYVCSASFVDVVKEISSNPDFNYLNNDQHVIAMELERDNQGVIQSEFRKGYVQTQGKGKTEAIHQFLVKKYGYGPIMIAGDSEGDQNMMQDFEDTKLVLIINRLRSNDSDIGQLSQKAAKEYKAPEAKYLLQGRDENLGVFIPSQLHIKLGETEGKVVR